MDDFDISVIIPTYNREASLKKALTSFSRQTYPHDKFEIIVVDDGSTDATESVVRQLQNEMPYALRYFKQPNSGPGSARNEGIRQARSSVILFTGDDILPKEDLLEQYLEIHNKQAGVAVLGFIEWSREIMATDFMNFLAPDGFQFRYGSIKDADDCDFRHFYTSNISLAKKWFSQDSFDEDFPYAALEDTELAYRLKNKGLKIILNKKAVGYHHHFISPEEFYNKMRAVGYCASILLKKHPELRSIFLPVDILFARIIALILKCSGFFLKINNKWYWRCRIIISYIEGFEKGPGNCK
jgi:glycosyltransferase involved in cell wall biosynthesis